MKNYDLLWAREHAGLTQAQLADQIGVSRGQFCKWETGKVAMPKRKWFALLKLLEVTEADVPKHVEIPEAPAKGLLACYTYEDEEGNPQLNDVGYEALLMKTVKKLEARHPKGIEQEVLITAAVEGERSFLGELIVRDAIERGVLVESGGRISRGPACPAD